MQAIDALVLLLCALSFVCLLVAAYHLGYSQGRLNELWKERDRRD